MIKQKKSQAACGSSSYRNFKVTHQNLSITDINFKKQILTGLTELTIVPLTSTGKLWKFCLNCKQCRILRIIVNGHLRANYSYMDPTLCICPTDSKKRNLEYFDSCHGEKVRSCDSDCTSSAGELIVKIPKDTYSSSNWECTPIKMRIEFSLEQPKGGIQFITPSSGASTDVLKHAHAYVHGFENSSRLWFPCIDSYSEGCLWDLSFSVPACMMAVSCGEFMEMTSSPDGKKKTFKYTLHTPTPAPAIGFAIGCFEVYPDPIMQEVTHFCLPGLLPILKNTVQFVHQVFGFYEELLSSRFPHSSYKLVFVDGLSSPFLSFSTMGLFDTNLLHSQRIIEQVMVTRKVIGEAIAKQYFGCYIVPQFWNDWWLPTGISGYLAGLFVRKIFGNTEYMNWIMMEQKKVCEYEQDHLIPPLCGTLASLQETPSLPVGRMNFHPKLVSGVELAVLSSKAHLVLHMIQLKIGQDLLLQVFNKLLTLASAACQSQEYSLWHNVLASTEGFMKLMVTVSGKDMSHFMEQWVFRNGVPRLFSSYSFVRKKNFIELKIQQEVPQRCTKFVGSMTVIVQEFDGCFPHNIQIEDLVSSHELPCHSKIRKAKKRKVPLIHGEEVEIDISSLDNEVPILWVHLDPDFQWIRELRMEQSDVTWMNVLKYERNGIAQLDALEALQGMPSMLVRDSFKDAILTRCFYYQVRLQAAENLAKYLTDTAGTGSSPAFLIAIYQRLFGSSSQQNIIRFNDFTDISLYFLQKGLALCIARMRNLHKQCSKEVLNFLMDLFKYSDNQNNKYSADYFTSALIDALAETVTPKVAVSFPSGVDFAKNPTAGLAKEAQIILQEIVQHLNIEKVLPSYKLTVTCSCLRCLRVLQKNGHLPSDSSLFRDYAEKWNFIDVRKVAVRAIADIVQADQSKSDLIYLLDMVETDELRMSLEVLSALMSKPPFTRRMESKLNHLTLVERLWTMMSSGFYFDSQLRTASVQFYMAMFARLTPSCVPQGLGIVIDLKEKVARSNFASPITTPRTSVDLKPLPTVTTTPQVYFPEDSSSVRISTLASGAASSVDPGSPPSSPIALQTASDAACLPQVKVTVLDQNTLSCTPPPPPPSGNETRHTNQPPISLKIQTPHMKRLAPSLGLLDVKMRSATGSPDSVISTDAVGALSDDEPAHLSPSTSSHPHKHKRHKAEQKHKHKKKKSKKSKHKHKHSSHQEIDVETL